MSSDKNRVHNLKAGEYRPKKQPVVSTIVVWLILILVAIFGYSYLSGVDDRLNTVKNETETTSQADKASQAAANKQSIVDRYAPEYCSTHQAERTIFEDSHYPSNDGSGWTDDECTRIIDILYDSGSTETEISNVVNSRVWIGMTELEMWYSLGNPDDINTSNYGGVVSKQHIYGYNYIYTDRDGIVTSYQL